MAKIILLAGKAEAGKTASSHIIKEAIGEIDKKVAMLPYGWHVKETAKQILGWNGKKDQAGRDLLQWWGTDVVRQRKELFWIESVKNLVDVMGEDFDYVIVDDNRFRNEINAWDGYNTVTILIERPGHENGLTEEQRTHISENDLNGHKFDLVISATNLSDLHTELFKNMKFILQ